MSGYNYRCFISDFGVRTKENQKRIDMLREEDRKNGLSENELNYKHHEVTQLINSLFGLLIVPYEKYKFNPAIPDHIDSMGENDLKLTKEYYKIADMIISLEKRNRLYNGFEEKNIVSSFIKHLRNSLAHSGNEGIQFMPIEEHEAIKTVLFHDKDHRGKEFCAELSVGDIRKLSSFLSEMYKKLEYYRFTNDLPQYKKKYDDYLNLIHSSKNNWAKSFEESLKRDEQTRQSGLL